MAIVTLQFVKDYLGITDTAYDTKITALIPAVEQTYLDIRNVPFELDTDGVTIIYPTGSDITSSEMIGFKLSTTSFSASNPYGVIKQSETIDAHSISYGDALAGGTSGYPKSITSSIKRYIDGR